MGEFVLDFHSLGRRGKRPLLEPILDSSTSVGREAPFMKVEEKIYFHKGRLERIISVRARKQVYFLCEFFYRGCEMLLWIPDHYVLKFKQKAVFIDFIRTLYFYHINLFNSIKKRACETLRMRMDDYINEECREVKILAKGISKRTSVASTRAELGGKMKGGSDRRSLNLTHPEEVINHAMTNLESS